VVGRWEEELDMTFERREADGVAIGVYFAPGVTNS
jgi:hypothetical protein